jgi:hypothetical protein
MTANPERRHVFFVCTSPYTAGLKSSQFSKADGILIGLHVFARIVLSGKTSNQKDLF